MEIHQLEYFVAIVETGSFSRAAESCRVAQPSLSQQIKKLETEMGTPLFDRLGRKVVLTNSGRILLPRARRILQELQRINVDLHTQIEDGYGDLAVGFIPTIAPFVLPVSIRRFNDQFRSARITIHENLTDELLDKITAGELDIGITSLPIKNKLVKSEELAIEPLVLAVPQNFAGLKDSRIQVQDINGLPFIAINEIHCLGEQVQSFCDQENVNLNIVCDTSQLSTVQDCVRSGLGISLVPNALAEEDCSGKIVYRHFSDAEPSRRIAAVYHERRNLSNLGRGFIEIVRQAYPCSS